MAEVRFDTFYRYDELTEILQGFAAQAPDLCEVASLGRSHEDRDIWLVTLTDTETGPHSEKPALWIEANIHSVEVTASTAALHLIHYVILNRGDDKVRRALETRTLYVVPRLNPDGAEAALADRPRLFRSSSRPYPHEQPKDGLHREDIDGDGRLLTIRMPDPNGPWKVHPEEPRLMVRREPDEEGGDYYRLFPEGTIKNFDGVNIEIARPVEGLDLNRNFPMEWAPEHEQLGSGPYPTSEPEIRAEVQAIVDRPNVCAYITYHTQSGVHLRPYSSYDDDHFPTQDLRVFKWIGEEATKITSYPAISIYHDFRYDPKTTIKGGSDDWLYDHLGVYAWTTEFWAPLREAGIKDYKYIEWYREHPIEDDLALLKWNDEKLDGKGFVDWYPFEHPQLGDVELGGWDVMYCWANVPPQFLESEIEPHSEFAIFHLLISPLLKIASAEAEEVTEGTFHLRAVVMNTGWLPTNVSQKAMDRKAVEEVEVELGLPEGAKLIQGDLKQDLGQLGGRDQKRHAMFFNADATDDRKKVEWVISAPRGGSVEIVARHPRAGTERTEVPLA